MVGRPALGCAGQRVGPPARRRSTHPPALPARRPCTPAAPPAALTGGHALGGIHLGDQVVGRVGHDGAEDARDVARGKRHAQLLRLAALRLGLGHHILVQRLHHVLKGACGAGQGGGLRAGASVGGACLPACCDGWQRATLRCCRPRLEGPSTAASSVNRHAAWPLKAGLPAASEAASSAHTELHHRVRDLTAPQRRDALKQPAHALLLHKLGQAVGEAARVPRHRLHLDLQAGREGGDGQAARQEGGGRVRERGMWPACSSSRLEHQMPRAERLPSLKPT